jgi:hypothetical protein
MDTISKVCAKCKTDKPLSEYYFRNGNPHSYCKTCIKDTANGHRPISQQIPKDQSEIAAIEYLRAKGIPSLPGKSLKYSWVDVVAFGCIRIEVKSSKLFTDSNYPYFKWSVSSTQLERGVLADLIMLMCRYEDKTTFHMFKPDCPAFWINGQRKTGFAYRLGAIETKKHIKGRVIMTENMMDESQDKLKLIYEELDQYVNRIKIAS